MSELPLTFPTQLRRVQQACEDFEWYPTTDEIIRRFIRDLGTTASAIRYDHYRSHDTGFLDIGAGNGKVIDAVRRLRDDEKNGRDIGRLYAIEKSHQLLNMLPENIYVLGVDYWNTSLHDKSVRFIFTNPPYSRFAEWSAKTIREAPHDAYLWMVLPERWETNASIQAEILVRKAKVQILDAFDFQDAEDRAARAKVHLIRIDMPSEASRGGSTDPFARFFDETFHFPDPEEDETDNRKFDEVLEETKVVRRLNFVEALCHLYDERMLELSENYEAVCAIRPDILKEFDISKASLMKSLKMKLATAKKEYWQRLFDGMDAITRRLTVDSRKAMVERLNSHTGIEFNRDNAYAVIFWAVKNANQYFDSQLIDTYERLVDKANVENYVSNKRIFQWNRFAYGYRVEKDDFTHYRLKVGHRMVVHAGGISVSYSRREFSERGRNFLSDLATVAHNLGFPVSWDDVATYAPSGSWASCPVEAGEAFVIRYKNERGKWESLMRIRAFENGNLHIQFLPEFIQALNTMHGRLKGWLRDDAEAAAELDMPAEVAAKHFKPAFRLEAKTLALMAPAETAA